MGTASGRTATAAMAPPRGQRCRGLSMKSAMGGILLNVSEGISLRPLLRIGKSHVPGKVPVKRRIFQLFIGAPGQFVDAPVADVGQVHVVNGVRADAELGGR